MQKDEIITRSCDKMLNDGYSCAQAIVFGMIAMIREYEQIDAIKEAEYINIAGGFGGGVAGLRQTCGYTTGSAIGYSLIIKDNVELLKEKIAKINDVVVQEGGNSQCAKIIEKYEDQSLAGRKSQCVLILEKILQYIYIDLIDVYK